MDTPVAQCTVADFFEHRSIIERSSIVGRLRGLKDELQLLVVAGEYGRRSTAGRRRGITDEPQLLVNAGRRRVIKDEAQLLVVAGE